MKLTKFLYVFLSLNLIYGITAGAAEVGVLQLAGTGCDIKEGPNKLTPVKGVKNRFTAPIQLSEDKPVSNIVRKSCSFSLPIKLGPKEKIQIINAAQTISLRATPISKAGMQTELFLAGQTGQLLKSEIESQKVIARSNQKLVKNGLIVESKCGGDVILRANSSVLLTGAGTGRAVTQPLAFDLKVVNCL